MKILLLFLVLIEIVFLLCQPDEEQPPSDNNGSESAEVIEETTEEKCARLEIELRASQTVGHHYEAEAVRLADALSQSRRMTLDLLRELDRSQGRSLAAGYKKYEEIKGLVLRAACDQKDDSMDIPPWTCPFCVGKEFWAKADLREHRIMHDVEDVDDTFISRLRRKPLTEAEERQLGQKEKKRRADKSKMETRARNTPQVDYSFSLTFHLCPFVILLFLFRCLDEGFRCRR